MQSTITGNGTHHKQQGRPEGRPRGFPLVLAARAGRDCGNLDDHQLDFVTPGSCPAEAISRNVIRES